MGCDMEWRPVYGYEGYYEVSECGDVRSIDRVVLGGIHGIMKRKGKILKVKTNRNGYDWITLYKQGARKHYFVHVLVLGTFVSPKPEGMVCCHNNGIRNDSRVENLRWATQKENIQDSVRHGTWNHGEKIHTCKLKECEVILIKHLLKNNIPHSKIEKMFKISQSVISKIRNNKIWKHVSILERGV